MLIETASHDLLHDVAPVGLCPPSARSKNPNRADALGKICEGDAHLACSVVVNATKRCDVLEQTPTGGIIMLVIEATKAKVV